MITLRGLLESKKRKIVKKRNAKKGKSGSKQTLPKKFKKKLSKIVIQLAKKMK